MPSSRGSSWPKDWTLVSGISCTGRQEMPLPLLLLLFSHPVVSDSLWPHGLQHARSPCPSPSPGVCPSSLHQWCHPAILSSNTLFSFCPQSFPVSGTFPMSHLLASGDQNTGASASASVLPMNIQDSFSLGLILWSPSTPRDSQESSPIPQFKSINSSALSLL